MCKKSEFTINPMLCYHCGNETVMKNVGVYSHITHDEEYGSDEKKWFMFLCPVCSDITVIKEYSWSEETDEYGHPIVTTTILYPPINYNRGIVPNTVKQAFESALKVRNIDGAICALSIRRTLEMICKEKGENSGDLYSKLSRLASRGIIPPLLDKMASPIRKLGNAAAHGDEIDFPKNIIDRIIEFTQVIIEYLYVLPDKIREIESELE